MQATTNKQTNKQTDKQTNKQTNKQASKQKYPDIMKKTGKILTTSFFSGRDRRVAVFIHSLVAAYATKLRFI